MDAGRLLHSLTRAIAARRRRPLRWRPALRASAPALLVLAALELAYDPYTAAGAPLLPPGMSWTAGGWRGLHQPALEEQPPGTLRLFVHEATAEGSGGKPLDRRRLHLVD